MRCYFDQLRVPKAIAEHIQYRLRAIGHRFAALLTFSRAGEVKPPRPRAPAPFARPAGFRSPVILPRYFGWFIGMVWFRPEEAEGHARDLQLLLAEPDTQALIAAAPRQMGWLLRPLCWMLKIDAKNLLPLPPPRRVRASRTAEAGRSATQSPAQPHRSAAGLDAGSPNQPLTPPRVEAGPAAVLPQPRSDLERDVLKRTDQVSNGLIGSCRCRPA